MKKIVAFCRGMLTKYREQILYLIFGVLTTLVDFAVSYLLYYLEWNVHLADTAAWIAAVLFAYVTNRKWVFESRRTGFFPICAELAAFAGGRVFTFFLQEGLVWVFYDTLEWNKYLVRVPVAVLVVILNYVIGKLLVFRKKKTEEKALSEPENGTTEKND